LLPKSSGVSLNRSAPDPIVDGSNDILDLSDGRRKFAT
jgi:hypothetical protein